jgi:CRISPR-associated protein Cas6
MYWQDDEGKKSGYQVPDDVVDLSYRISCRALPIDHAYSLSRAIHQALPWLADDPGAGVHLIHGAESGNGWYRPEDSETALLHLSRRARMMLRLPKDRIEQARELEGAELDIQGHSLTVGAADVKKLSSLSTLFARYVVIEDDADEEAFLRRVIEEFAALGLDVRKLMCGKEHCFRTPEGTIRTRAVMVADLEPEQSVRLQQKGIGSGQKMGFGLFIPHKGIKAVKETH